MARKRPTEVSWDSDDDLLKDDLPSVSAFPQTKSNEDLEEMDEDELLGFYDESEGSSNSKKNNTKPRNSVFDRISLPESKQTAPQGTGNVMSRLAPTGTPKTKSQAPVVNSTGISKFGSLSKNSAKVGTGGTPGGSTGSLQRKTTPKTENKIKTITPIVYNEPEPEPEPELILDVDESLDFGLDETQEYVSESIIDTSQSEEYEVVQEDEVAPSFVEEVEEEQNISQETSQLEVPDVNESSDESESDDDDSRRGRFKSERTHSITTVKTLASKQKGDIPDTLEISTEQQAEIDQFLQHGKGRYNQRGRNRGRGGRGRGIQGRLGPPMSQQQVGQPVPSVTSRGGINSNPSAVPSHGQVQPISQPQPHPQRIHVNPHFRGSNPNQPPAQNMAPHPTSTQFSRPQQMVPHSQAGPQPLLHQPLRPPQPQSVVAPTSHVGGWGPSQPQHQPPYPVHNGPPSSQPRYHHQNNQPFTGSARPPSSASGLIGMAPGQQPMAPGQHHGQRPMYQGPHISQSQGPQPLMPAPHRPHHLQQQHQHQSPGYHQHQFQGHDPHFRPPNNNQYHPSNNQFSQQPHNHYQQNRMPPPQPHQMQDMPRAPQNHQFGSAPRGPSFQPQQQRFQSPPRQPIPQQQHQHHHQGPPQQFRNPRPQRNMQQQQQQQHGFHQQQYPSQHMQQPQQQFQQQGQRPQRPQQNMQFGNKKPAQNTALLQQAKRLQDRARKFQSQQIPVISRTAQKRPSTESTAVQHSPPKQPKSMASQQVQQAVSEIPVDPEIKKKLEEQARLREQIRKRKEANRLAEAKKKREELVQRLAEKGQTIEDIEKSTAIVPQVQGQSHDQLPKKVGQIAVQQGQVSMQKQGGDQKMAMKQKAGQQNLMAWQQKGPDRQMSNPGQGQMSNFGNQPQGVKRQQTGVIQLNKNNNQGPGGRPQSGSQGEPGGKRMKKVTILRKNAQGQVIYRKTVLKPIDEPTSTPSVAQPQVERQINVCQPQVQNPNVVRQFSSNSQNENRSNTNTPRTVVTKSVPANRSVVIRGGGVAGQNINQQNVNQANRRVVMGLDGGVGKTKKVLIKNLSVSTTEHIIKNLCTVVGPVENIQLNKGEKQAVVTFLNVDHAGLFAQKYNRHMVDLSHISVSLLRN